MIRPGKSATSSTSTIAQQQKQGKVEAVPENEKKRLTTERTVDKGDEGEERAAEKVPSTEEKLTKHDRRGRMRESKSERLTDRAKPYNSSSADSQSREEKSRPSHSKKRQPSPVSRRDAIPSTKSRSSSNNRSPNRSERSGGTKRIPSDRTWQSPVPNAHNERSLSPPFRKSVVLPSKGPPALRSVISLPAQFSSTAHPRVRAVDRSPSPPPSSLSPFSPSPPRLSCSSPQVMLSGGIVPIMPKAATNRLKIVNQLDIAAATTQSDRRLGEEETKTSDSREIVGRKQQIIRTALSPPPRNDQPKQTTDAATSKLARRRVIFGGGSLIFQRAIQQQKTVATTAVGVTSTQKAQPKATVVVRPQIRMVTVSSPENAKTEENGGQTPVVEAIPTTKQPQPVQRRAIAVVAQQQTGVSLFQRAIKETKRQQRTEGGEADGMGKRPKRLPAERLEPINATTDETEEWKRPRIEKEAQEKEEPDKEEEKKPPVGKEEIGTEEKSDEEEKQEEGEKEEVLTIDMSRRTDRRREIKRPPKFGLELVKEHISGVQKEEQGEKGQQQMEKEQQQQIPQKPLIDHGNTETKNVQNAVDVQLGAKERDNGERNDGKETPERTVHFKRNWTSHASALTTAAPIWDGRIEIDDMSSTDDEAEIDAVLADAQRLRKLALERELPPTAAMSRPLLYNPLDFSLSPESALLSPSDAALLPAVSYKQLMMLSGGGLLPEKQSSSAVVSSSVAASSATVGVAVSAVATHASPAASDGAQQQLLPHQRPHATVAPTTTIQAAPATMIVQQQYHYNLQNQHLRPRSHPYSQGYVPTLAAHDYRYQVNRGSVSKVYIGGHKLQFCLQQQQQNATVGNKECLKQRLCLLREQHQQKTQSLQRQLEEQRLLLGQLQKMAPTEELEQRKELLSRVRQMDAPIEKLKCELEEVCEQITKATKCDA